MAGNWTVAMPKYSSRDGQSHDGLPEQNYKRAIMEITAMYPGSLSSHELVRLPKDARDPEPNKRHTHPQPHPLGNTTQSRRAAISHAVFTCFVTGVDLSQQRDYRCTRVRRRRIQPIPSSVIGMTIIPSMPLPQPQASVVVGPAGGGSQTSPMPLLSPSA